MSAARPGTRSRPGDGPPTPATVHLRGGGVSVVLDATGPGLPRVVHWGADLGETGGPDAGPGSTDATLVSLARATVPPVPNSALDEPSPVRLVPAEAEGFGGTPGLTGHRPDGRGWTPRLRRHALARPDDGTLVVTGRDEDAGLTLVSTLDLDASGVLRVRHVLRNDGDDPYAVGSLLASLPVPGVARELLDLTGRWCKERQPQRHPFLHGTWRREGRHGRTGHDASLLLVAGTPGFGFRTGEVWGVHVAWSGDHVSYAERLPTGASVLGGGELLHPGEVVLAPGEEYATPWVYATWSDRGLDGLSARLHTWARSRGTHPRRPRPVVLNTWEAVYFDHDLDRLRGLADTAAEIGVERFVLDDGWFRHRRDDTAGLGDWYVDGDVWPDGLHPLVDHVRGLGMEFGLWVEPEMVNLDSDLARAHPDWVLGHAPVSARDTGDGPRGADGGPTPPSWRHQQVLDLTHPEAWAYVRDRLDTLLTTYDVAFLKWDHNRDLVAATHAGRAGVHAQTTAVYRLLDDLRARHPGVEVESCSSGGARVDLEVLARTDRVWASDCNDALERQAIQRWTGLLLPPELVGAHVGPPTAHTTGRTQDLSFRAATALFGHAGLEWDVTDTTPEERESLRAWTGFYREVRGLLHTGEVVRADHPDPAVWVHGVVGPDRDDALFAVVTVDTPADAVPGTVRLPGLDPGRTYRVTPVHPAGEPRTVAAQPPPWLADGGVTLTGRALASVGLQVPVLAPEQALLLRVTGDSAA